MGSRAASNHEVDVSVTASGAPSIRELEGWSRKVLARAAPKRSVSLSVLLCGDGRIRTLNRIYRDEDRPTDVLSFPSGEESGPFLGDVVVSVPYATRQARKAGHELSRELQILLVHGVLHLLGYDHETDDGEMFRLQSRLVTSVFGRGADGVPRGAYGVPLLAERGSVRI